MHNATSSDLPPVRRARLSMQDCFDVFLTHYPPHLTQPPHEHGCSQFSLVLAGEMIERIEGREFRAGAGHASGKSRGTEHADQYGAQGALILGFNFRCEETAHQLLSDKKWQWRSLPRRDRLQASRIIGHSREPEFEDELWDVLARCEPISTGTRAPEWLLWAKHELGRPRAPSIAQLAEQAGVHRVRLSREFTRHFGVPPSTYRQQQLASRALRALIHDKASAADAAYRAGFADQSHMIRTVREVTGLTPRRLASALRPTASV